MAKLKVRGLAGFNFDIAPVLRQCLGVEVPDVTGEKWRSCLCPFHDDRTPSASVNQFAFHCFSCGKSGDAVKLLMEESGETFREAYTRAAAATGREGETVRGRTGRKRPSSALFGF